MNAQYTETIGPLTQILWKFTMLDNVIYLENMYYMTRETPRHKFRVDNHKSYGRVHNRDLHIKEEPDVPIEISSAIVAELRQRIVFNKWESRYK